MKRMISRICIITLCIVVLFSMTFSANALTTSADKGYIKQQITKVVNYVKKYGYTNQQGYKTLDYFPQEGLSANVSYCDDGDYLEFLVLYEGDDGSETYIKMFVELPYTEIVQPEVDIFMRNGSSLTAYSTFSPDEYKIYTESLAFTRSSGTITSTYYIKTLCNSAFDMAFQTWDHMLQEYMGVYLTQFGFTGTCEHAWKTIIAKKAQIGITGIQYSRCSDCGLMKNKKTLKALSPAKTSISSLKAGKKSFTVKWKKKSYTGYQIRYSLKSSMGSSKTVTVGSAKMTSKTIKKLKAKKTYYVQVRTYKTVKGKKWYSGWSGKKSIKTKK